ncbi:uncharacterized protein G2W53_020395 [Senna tora]|uniref:Uncharacterized protein n=1 Tax=Senna tora TaxID=362788 RepID=A0A834TZ15_9FABA|nr:uncharacterized protein G2W53_020395 [Senna tora]
MQLEGRRRAGVIFAIAKLPRSDVTFDSKAF